MQPEFNKSGQQWRAASWEALALMSDGTFKLVNWSLMNNYFHLAEDWED